MTIGTNITQQLVATLSVTMPSGTSIYVTNASGVQQAFTVSNGTTYSLDVTGGTGTWAVKLAQYSKLSQSFTFTPSTGGTFSYSPALTPDIGITQASSTDVADYTKLENLDKLYDYAAYYETTNTGIALPRTLEKASTSLSSNIDVVLSDTGLVFAVTSNTLTVNTGVLAKGVTFSGGLVTTGNLTLGPGTQAASAGSYAALAAASIALPSGVNYQDISATGGITGLSQTGTVSAGGSISFGASTISATGSLTFVDTKLAGNLTVSTSVARDVILTDCSGSFVPAVSGAGSTVYVLNGITNRNILPTTMPANTSVAPSTVSFVGVAIGSRIVVRQGSVVKDTVLTTQSTTAFSTEYVKGETVSYEIYHPTKQPLLDTVTLSQALANVVTVEQLPSSGVESSSVTVKNINGVAVNPNGKVSIDVVGKTITFESLVSLRQALTALHAAWVNQSALYLSGEIIPFNLDSVQGIEISSDYTTVNPDISEDEGWRTIDSSGITQSINYNFEVVGNTSNVKATLLYDGVAQTPIYVLPAEDKLLIDIDQSATTILINSLLKRQNIVFVSRTETIKSGDVWQRFYKNSNTAYVEIIDAAVTQLLPDDTSKYRLLQQSVNPPPDANNVQHTFDRIIEIEPGTQTRESIINQLAAIATFDNYYTAKPYYLNASGKVVIDAGTWVRQRDGTELTGNAAGTLIVSSVANGVYVNPEVRQINLTLASSALLATSLNPVKFVLYKTSDGSILVDASGFEVVGTLVAGELKVITIEANTDISFKVATVHPTYSEAFVPQILTSGTINFIITPVLATVMAPSVDSMFDDPSTGELAWKDVVNTITFDTTAKDVIIPTEVVNGSTVKNYNLAYIYFAWRRWILSDVKNMRFGYAVYAEHQLAPPGSVDYSYKFQPGVWFDESWALNVSAARPVSEIVQIQASQVDRRDPSANSGLVYRSPLANGATTMATVVIAGAATEVIRNAYQQSVLNYVKLTEMQGNLGVINTGVKKASLGIPHASNL